jgi:hypothetical protein
MAYSSPATVVTATTITSTWGNSVKAATDYLANPPACRVYHSTTQSAANATATTLSFNSERYDTNTMHDTVTNNSRITMTTAGLYLVTAHVAFAANATGQRDLYLQVNATTYIAMHTNPTIGAGGETFLSVATVFKFAASDYIIARVFQNSGGALNVNGSSLAYGCEMSATWVGLG